MQFFPIKMMLNDYTLAILISRLLQKGFVNQKTYLNEVFPNPSSYDSLLENKNVATERSVEKWK